MHHSHNYRHEIILRMRPPCVANHLRQVERILLTVDILIHIAEHHCRRSVLQPVEAGVHLGLLVVVLHLHAILQSRPGVVDHLYIALTDQMIERVIPGRCTQETETTMRSYAMKAETGLVMRGGETNGVGDGVGAAICVRKALNRILVGATGSVADFRKGRTMAGSDGVYSLTVYS